ncbi:Muskelin 1, intracellular mediator containing kelch motif [Rhizoclosmatium sp. JEL0117]|nr:Muskelin 1, intracellular mediator containing kelch motif [Rhizoclosmatium sp. JEL0117]
MNKGSSDPPPTPTKLEYDIASWSSHSAAYHPRHIRVNRPSDQGSRWSSGANNQLQFVALKLSRPAVVQTITFGKYHKVHVCNLKEFKVFGGLSLDNMQELLHSGLRNDSEPETFSLKYKQNGVVFPCQYIKIAPHLAWGPNFNFSIWYVELRGLQQPEYVDKIQWNYINYRENQVIRLCMKHFRQRNYLDAFEALQTRTNLQLEDPLLTELHASLVINGDFTAAENILQQAFSRNLFTEYVHESSYKPEWRRIKNDGGEYFPIEIRCELNLRTLLDAEAPCCRGGHQMCVDSEGGLVYIFGGWDGQKDLSDFWSFNVETRQWKCISMDTRRMNGPGPRSCHKICFDPATKSIYTLGRYVDPDSRPNVNLDGDFWKYDTVSSRWTKISSNTLLDGGPELIYDHQMIVDSDTQTMYIFGGRTIGPDANQVSYSGLYSYKIPTNQWTLLRTDTSHPDIHSIRLKSRIGHSMLFNPLTRELYIFAGQREKDYLSDFYIYEVDTDTVHEVSRDYSKQNGPEAGFTQRATIDASLGEFYVLSGLQKDKNTTQESVKNSFWRYSLTRAKWTRVYHNENVGAEYWASMKDVEPCPRFAHQLGYDHVRKVQYLFGGNPGDPTNMNLRLDDFWELVLLRPDAATVLRRAWFRVRRLQFKEMCFAAAGDSGRVLAALEFLRTRVAEVVDHADEGESKEFRDLAQYLFSWKNSVAVSGGGGGVGGLVATETGSGGEGLSAFTMRSEVYDLLLDYFPTSMREPKGNLVDLIDMIPAA